MRQKNCHISAVWKFATGVDPISFCAVFGCPSHLLVTRNLTREPLPPAAPPPRRAMRARPHRGGRGRRVSD